MAKANKKVEEFYELTLTKDEASALCTFIYTAGDPADLSSLTKIANVLYDASNQTLDV